MPILDIRNAYVKRLNRQLWALLSAILYLAALTPARATAQQDWRLSIGTGSTLREARDYGAEGQKWGWSQDLGAEQFQSKVSSIRLTIAHVHYGDVPIVVPPLDLVPAVKLRFSRELTVPGASRALAESWDPVVSNELTAWRLDGEVRRYVIGSIQDGIYLGAGVGYARLGIPGQSANRLELHPAIGVQKSVRGRLGMYVDARYENVSIAPESVSSPRWFIPLSVGFTLSP